MILYLKFRYNLVNRFIYYIVYLLVYSISSNLVSIVYIDTVAYFLIAQSIIPPNSLKIYPLVDRYSGPFVYKVLDIASKI